MIPLRTIMASHAASLGLPPWLLPLTWETWRTHEQGVAWHQLLSASTHVEPGGAAHPFSPDLPVHVFLAVCDHYEPEWGHADHSTAWERVSRWVTEYPRLLAEVHDVRGRPPQHTFFFPQDQYHPAYLELLHQLVIQGWGDVEVHLHHDRDTAEGLREKLQDFVHTLYAHHGLLRRDTRGQIAYGFIHGNWALANCRPDGRWCGVAHELSVLRQTGCYADFTFPSAPDVTQPTWMNGVVYARDAAHGRGWQTVHVAEVGRPAPSDALLLISGPLLWDLRRRKAGVLPRLENGDVLASHPWHIRRLPLWMQARIQVRGRPNWWFIKLHTHGCKPANLHMWLSSATRDFHHALAQIHRHQPWFRYYYVTAWEMAQLIHAAEHGESDPLAVLSGSSFAGSTSSPLVSSSVGSSQQT
ncbi:MAG: hypothetical protein KatS3mg114_1269 [Planctomycetaceae bacterium]|nr:MAG: hypothetical protein KatS3mg114_1269 [Planctomycetaceae bacterium]